MTVLQTERPATELDALEIHTGILLGQRRTSPLPDGGEVDTNGPEQTLEDLLLPALCRYPCLVGYSGGRDSAALLAAATSVARRHGLPDPVPITLRFPDHPRTDERAWQELTIDHLGLSDWLIIDDELDLEAVGSLAQATLRRDGLYWPPNAHHILPLMERASGGALLTGNGGDELFTPWLWFRVARVRRGRMLPGRVDLKPLAFSLMPAFARRVGYERFSTFALPWLKPAAARELRRRFGADLAYTGSWRADLESYLSSRYREVGQSTFGRLADATNTLLVEPFFEPRYVRGVAGQAARYGFGSRTEAMRTHFGRLLPDAVLQRSDKAVFTEVSVGPSTRAFAEAWDGSGVDRSLVDVEQVRSMWLSERPTLQSLTMLQAAWLASLG
jgi:Asparagine synthase